MANSALWADGSSTFNAQASGSPTLSVSLDPINLWSTGNLALFTTSRVVAVTLDSSSPVNILYSTDGGESFSSFATNATTGVITGSISLNIGTYDLVFKIEGEATEYPGYQVVVSRLVILGSGQSNMVGEGGGADEPLYTDPSGNTSWLLGLNDEAQPMKNQWSDNTEQVDEFIKAPVNSRNAWMIFLANKLVAEYSEPVICVPAARGGTTIAEWQKDATEMRGDNVPAGQNNLYNASLRRFNVVGGATLNLLQLGENDAINGNATTTTEYKDGVIRYAGDVKSDMGLDTIIVALHTLTGSSWSGNGTTTGQAGIRAGQIEAANEDDNVYITEPTTTLGATGGDGVHITNPVQMDGLADIVLSRVQSYVGGVVIPTVSVSTSATPTVGDTFTPTASASNYDSLLWTCTSGQSPTFSDATVLQPSITANETGLHTFRLTATNTDGSAFDEFSVTVSAVANIPPTANAGTDLPTVTAGAQFQLNGSGVANQAGAAIVSYSWAQISTGTVVALSNPLINNPIGVAPSSDTTQTLTYELTVTDSNGLTAKDTVSVPIAAEVVAAESSNLSVTIKGSGSGVYEVSIFEISDLSTVIYNGDATFANDVMTVDVDIEAGIQVVGLWVGGNFPNSGGSFEGVTG